MMEALNKSENLNKLVHKVLDYYEISNDVFENSLSEIILKMDRFVDHYEYHNSLLNNKEKLLCLAALVDRWMQVKGTKEAKLMLLKFDLLSVDVNKSGCDSNLLQKIATNHPEWGRSLMVDMQKTMMEDSYKLVEKIEDKHINVEVTQDVNGHLALFGPGTLLDGIRSKLKITSKDHERPFEVVVLKEKLKELFDISVAAVYYYDVNKASNIIIFGPNWQDHYEHEYTHVQAAYGHGLRNGLFCGYFFRGFNEGVTESFVSKPDSYKDNRLIYRYICSKYPEFEEIVYQAYMGKPKGRKKFVSFLVSNYRASGYMDLGFMAEDRRIKHPLFTSWEDLEKRFYYASSGMEEVLERMRNYDFGKMKSA